MTSKSNSKPSRVKVQQHRERLREQGLRPIQIWVPDVRSRAFRTEAQRPQIAQKRTSGPEGPAVGLHLCRG